MTSQYRRGADFERGVRQLLQKNGYLCWRIAGSKGEGGVDLIAARGIDWLLIQCKTDGKLPDVERHAIIEAADRTFALPLLAFKADGKVRFAALRWGYKAQEWAPDVGLYGSGDVAVRVFRYPAMPVAGASDGFDDVSGVSCEVSASYSRPKRRRKWDDV